MAQNLSDRIIIIIIASWHFYGINWQTEDIQSEQQQQKQYVTQSTKGN